MTKTASGGPPVDRSPAPDSWLTSLALHRGGFVPLHRQIHDLVRQEVVDGRLPSGARLPSEVELAEGWGVSLAPVRHALVDLAAEGYLDRTRGRGTFVQQPKFEEKVSILSSFSESHAEQGDRPELVVLRAGRFPAPADVVAALGMRLSKSVLIQRLAYLDATPVALLSAFLDSARFPGLEKRSLEGGSLYRTLESAYGIDVVRAKSAIEVVHVTDEEAAPLAMPTGGMALRVDSITYDRQDVAVEFSRVLYRVERFRFILESFRLDDQVLHLPSLNANDHDQKRTRGTTST